MSCVGCAFGDCGRVAGVPVYRGLVAQDLDVRVDGIVKVRSVCQLVLVNPVRVDDFLRLCVVAGVVRRTEGDDVLDEGMVIAKVNVPAVALVLPGRVRICVTVVRVRLDVAARVPVRVGNNDLRRIARKGGGRTAVAPARNRVAAVC